ASAPTGSSPTTSATSPPLSRRSASPIPPIFLLRLRKGLDVPAGSDRAYQRTRKRLTYACCSPRAQRPKNRAMSIASQAAYPESALCRFLDARLPQRRLIVDDWARQVDKAPWSAITVAMDYRSGLGLA